MTVPEIRRIGVVGLGAMGAGIAQLAIEAGYETVGREVTDELGDAGARADRALPPAKGRQGADERRGARGCTRAALAHDGARRPRRLRPRHRGDRRGARREARRSSPSSSAIVRADAILATNTSALSVTEIAAAVSTPARVVGMHFFNPAPLMPLVEIVRAELSSDEAVEAAFAVGERLGKRPIRCHDTPGFVVNRVLIPLLNDCLRVLDEARVSPEDLDTAMTAGAGWPMGPCTLVDLVGIDVHVHASEALYEKLREPRMAPPPRIVAMKNAGLLGRKSGRGFYVYE